MNINMRTKKIKRHKKKTAKKNYKRGGGLFSKKEKDKEIKNSLIDRYFIYEKDTTKLIYSTFTKKIREEKEIIHNLFKKKNETDKKEILSITEIFDTQNNDVKYGEDIFLLPGGLVNPTSVCVDDKIYLIGGYDYLDYHNTMYIYDTKNENKSKIKWYSGKSMIHKYKSPKAVAVNNKIYVFGVLYEENEDKEEDDESNEYYCNTCNKELEEGKLDINPDKFKKCQETCGESFGTVIDTPDDTKETFMDKIDRSMNDIETVAMMNIMGGGNNSNFSCEIFDIDNNKWSQGPSMKYPREDMCIVTKNNKIYLIGGTVNYQAVNTVEIYDIEKNQYIEGEKMNNNRSGAAACVTTNFIYIFGGTDNKNDLFSSEIFDIQNNKWSKGLNIKNKESRCYHSCEVIGDNIYLICGYNGTCNCRKCLLYNDEEKKKKEEELLEEYKKNPNKLDKFKKENTKYGNIGDEKMMKLKIDRDIKKLKDDISESCKMYGKDSNQILIYNIKDKNWKSITSNLGREKITTSVYENKIYILGGTCGRKRIGRKVYNSNYSISHAFLEYMNSKENYYNLTDKESDELNLIKQIEKNDKFYNQYKKELTNAIEGNQFQIDELNCFNQMWSKMDENQQNSADILGYDKDNWPYPIRITTYQEYYKKHKLLLKFKNDIDTLEDNKPPIPNSRDLKERKEQIFAFQKFNKNKQKLIDSIPEDIIYEFKCKFPELIPEIDILNKELKDNFEKTDDSNIDVGNLFDEEGQEGGNPSMYIKYLKDKMLNDPDNLNLSALLCYYTDKQGNDKYIDELKNLKISQLWRKLNDIDIDNLDVEIIEKEEDTEKQKDLLINLFSKNYEKNKNYNKLKEIREKLSIHDHKWNGLDDKYKKAWTDMGLEEWQWPPGHDNNFVSRNKKIEGSFKDKLKQELFYIINPGKWKNSSVMQSIPMALMGGIVGGGFFNHTLLGPLVADSADPDKAAAVGPIAQWIGEAIWDNSDLLSGPALYIAGIPLSMAMMIIPKMGIEASGKYLDEKIIADYSWYKEIKKQTDKNTYKDTEKKIKGGKILGIKGTFLALGITMLFTGEIRSDMTDLLTDDDGKFDLFNDSDGDGTMDIFDDDNDGDGVTDAQELEDGTDAMDAEDVDSDHDGVTDAQELDDGTDATDAEDVDTDHDDVTDDEERDLGTDANAADSDGDGVTDGDELRDGTDATDAEDVDSDHDGVTDADAAAADADAAAAAAADSASSEARTAVDNYTDCMNEKSAGLWNTCDDAESECEVFKQAWETARATGWDTPGAYIPAVVHDCQ